MKKIICVSLFHYIAKSRNSNFGTMMTFSFVEDINSWVFTAARHNKDLICLFDPGAVDGQQNLG